MYIIISPKRILIVGTMVLTITSGLGIWDKKAAADSYSSLREEITSQNKQISSQDHFLQALGASSNEEVYDALLQGKSLAEIAGKHQADVDRIVNLQVAELSAQLDARFADGSLPLDKYFALKAEIADTVKRSVYGETTV